MKICTISGSVSRAAGGLFTSVRRLSQALISLEAVAVSVLGLEDEFSDADSPAWKPIIPEVFSVTGLRSFGYSAALKDRILRGGFDLLHVHGIWQYPSVAALQWHRKTKKPHVISPRGMLDPWALRNSRWKKRVAGLLFENAHLREAACLHALCESEAQSIRAFGLKNPICIIPNGIDLPVLGNAEMLKTETLRTEKAESKAQSAEGHAQDSERRPLGASPLADLRASDRKVLLYLGRLHPKKGLVNLLRAWAALRRTEDGRRKTAEWVLAIAGWDQGGHEAELKRLAAELGIAHADVRRQMTEDGSRNVENHQPSTLNVKPTASLLFIGPLFGGDKEATYRNCDAFILPSFSEGLPMVILEAWAHSKAVLMTPECNLPEGFSAGAAIRIAPSAESIAQGLKELFETSDSSRLALGASGRTLVVEKFAWPKIAADMRSVYDWVLARGPKPSVIV